jgi:2-methylisocitrate lyase-like PEP mutase family enzyme
MAQTAAKHGVPDFVVNARTDVLFQQDKANIADAVKRRKAFLAAGATTILVWGGGGSRNVHDDDIRTLVKELEGMVNVSMRLAEGFPHA